MGELYVLSFKKVSKFECDNEMFVTADGWGNLDRHCDVNMAEWD